MRHLYEKKTKRHMVKVLREHNSADQEDHRKFSKET